MTTGIIGFILGSAATALVVRKNVDGTNLIVAWIKAKFAKKV